jgi:hypothetical protein
LSLQVVIDMHQLIAALPDLLQRGLGLRDTRC